MTDSNDTNLKEFYSDFIVTSFSIIILFVVGALATSILTGNLKDSLESGQFAGLALGLFIFYYVRGVYNLKWTIIQLVFNAGLTTVEFIGLGFVTRQTRTAEISFGFFLIFLSIPIFISVNKQLLDIGVKKLNGQRRQKEPMRIL